MATNTLSLSRIKVQTARMLEIYDLLQREIADSEFLKVSGEERRLLEEAVRTVEDNMLQIQAHFSEYEYREENLPTSSEAEELEEIVNAVLQWCAANKEVDR